LSQLLPLQPLQQLLSSLSLLSFLPLSFDTAYVRTYTSSTEIRCGTVPTGPPPILSQSKGPNSQAAGLECRWIESDLAYALNETMPQPHSSALRATCLSRARGADRAPKCRPRAALNALFFGPKELCRPPPRVGTLFSLGLALFAVTAAYGKAKFVVGTR